MRVQRTKYIVENLHPGMPMAVCNSMTLARMERLCAKLDDGETSFDDLNERESTGREAMTAIIVRAFMQHPVDVCEMLKDGELKTACFATPATADGLFF